MIGTAGVAPRVLWYPTEPAGCADERAPLRRIKRAEARRRGTPRDQCAVGDFAKTDAQLLDATQAQPILLKRSRRLCPRGQTVRRPGGSVGEVLSVV